MAGIRGKREPRRAFFFLPLLFSCFLFLAAPARAETVPPHLASFSSSLYRQLEGKLANPSGSAEERQAMETARAALRRAGVANWSPQPVIQRGAIRTLADALQLDADDHEDRTFLESLIGEASPEGRQEQIAEMLKRKGRETDEAALNAALGAFDAARAETLKDMPRSYRLKLGETGMLETLWRPEENRVEMIVSGRIDDASGGEEYKTVLSGAAAPQATPEGDIGLDVRADEGGTKAYAGKSLERLRASIFGVWDGPRGEKWEITKADGSIPEPEAGTAPDRQAEIREKRKAIEELKKEKVFLWRNARTGKIERQKRFKRLDEPFVYEGESYGTDEGAQRLRALEAELSALESAAAKKLPVDEHDPVGIKTVADEAQPLRITVTQADGYRYTYRNAYFDGHRITADRTLQDRRDITELPDDVTGQLIASWSPPEWIELQVRPGARSSSLRLEGAWWRLHVTYSSGFFGMGENTVESIHTPYFKPLSLGKKGEEKPRNTAEGAAKEELI